MSNKNEIQEGQNQEQPGKELKEFGSPAPGADPVVTKDEVYEAALKELLEYREAFIKKYNIRCLLFAALPEKNENPIVVFDGEVLDYTALATTVARELRKRVLDRIGG